MISPDQIQEHAAHAYAGVREYRIFGPPGTGKTTNLSRQVRRGPERFGPPSPASRRRQPPNSAAAIFLSGRTALEPCTLTLDPLRILKPPEWF